MNLKEEVNNLIKKLKIKKGSTIYISGNIFSFGISSKDSHNFCTYIYKNLKLVIGPSGNIIVPTATWNLCNTNNFFHKNLKSYMMGVLPEFIRKKKESIRSTHPLWSFSGVGKNVKKIFKDVPPSAYGSGSVYERLLDYKTHFLCLGEPDNVLAMIHYVETITGVPYRYNKEFYVKVKEKGKIKKKYCTLLVLFKPKILERDYNRRIMKILKKKKIFKTTKFLKGKVYLCDYKLLVSELTKILIKNPKIWLKNEKIKQKKYHFDNYGLKFSKKKN